MDSKTLLYAGFSVPATLRTGEAVTVKLRLIKISEIPAYLDLVLDEAKALAFCIDSITRTVTEEKGARTEAVTASPDDFDDESYLNLVDENTGLNFTRALAMSDQRLKRAEQTGIGLAQIAASLASVLSRYSPKSPSPADTPASNSST